VNRAWLLAGVAFVACGRTLTYEEWLAEARGDSGVPVIVDAGPVVPDAGGPDGGGHVVAPGCAAAEVDYSGSAPDPTPAGIPRVALRLTFGIGIKGEAPWFDWSTVLLKGTAVKSGSARFNFEGVVLTVRVDAGDTAAAVVARVLRCARVPGYNFEASPPPNAFFRVRRVDSRVFAHIYADNSREGAHYVFEDNEGLPYWLAISEKNGAELLLMARGKPSCGGGTAARDPAERKLNKKQGVLFSWDGTHFTDAGSCLQRQMFDGGTLTVTACARLQPAAPLATPFTRADSGFPVDCISQQSAFVPIDPGEPTAVVFNW